MTVNRIQKYNNIKHNFSIGKRIYYILQHHLQTKIIIYIGRYLICDNKNNTILKVYSVYSLSPLLQ